MTFISPSTIKPDQHAKEYIASYWHKRAAGFAQLRLQELHSAKYSLWQQEITRHLPAGQTLRILDIGCGAGFFTIMLSRLGHQVTGIDLTPEMINAARTLAAKEKVKADFLTMDAEHTEFPASSFDVIIARNLMWNLPHPKQAYGEWLRILKAGGLLLNYDAEYAKNHHATSVAAAHADLSPALLEECHHLYHMLPISCYNRPAWDQQILSQLNCRTVIDTGISKRIYGTRDRFAIAVPMFCVKAVKA